MGDDPDRRFGGVPVETCSRAGHTGEMLRGASSDTYRRGGSFVALAVVVGGVVSVIVRTSTGTGPTTDVLDAGNLVAVGLVAAPSLVGVFVTRRWRIWWAESLLAIAAWAPLLGPAGDTSCVDCAFVLLLPMTVGVIQMSVLAIAWFSPSLRSR